MSDRDVDAQFADIVAHWDDVAAVPDHEATDLASRLSSGDTDAPSLAPESPGAPGATADAPTTVPTDPLADPATDAPTDGADGAERAEPGPAGGPVNPSPLSPTLSGIPVWRGATGQGASDADAEAGPHGADGEEDDAHFRPGPTAPLPPQEDLHFWGTVVGLVAGPLLLLWLVIFKPDVSGWWTLGALGLTVGGFILLVLRQPMARDDDDPDNGARV
jgi:hypothetical protein